MKRVLMGLCLVSAAALFACGGSVADEGQDGGTESVESTGGELIWKPLPDDWTDCTVNNQICRCSGDVVDCRNPRPIPPKKAATSFAPSRVGSSEAALP